MSEFRVTGPGKYRTRDGRVVKVACVGDSTCWNEWDCWWLTGSRDGENPAKFGSPQDLVARIDDEPATDPLQAHAYMIDALTAERDALRAEVERLNADLESKTAAFKAAMSQVHQSHDLARKAIDSIERLRKGSEGEKTASVVESQSMASRHECAVVQHRGDVRDSSCVLRGMADPLDHRLGRGNGVMLRD